MSEWSELQLGELATFKKGITYTSSDYGSEDSGRPFITIKCFIKGGGYERAGLKYINGNFSKEDRLLAGDVIFSVTDLTRAGDIVGSPLQVPSFGEEVYAVASMDCMRIEPNDAVCDKDFLYQRMMLWDIRRQMVSCSAGSTVLHLDTKQVPRMVVIFPLDTKVQKKIARILQTIDEAIEKTQALIDKYQQIKAGLMHDLFTRGIGPDGQLRPPREEAPHLYQKTPIGWIPKSWEVSKIRSLLARLILTDVQDGNHGESHPKKADFIDDGVPFVMASDISDGEINLEDCYKISERQYQSLRIGFSEPGDVLVSHKASIGFVAMVTDEAGKVMLTPQVTYYRTSDDVISRKYLLYFMRSPLFQHPLKKLAQQSTRDYIGITAQKELRIAFPLVLAEQNEISRRSASIEEKLNTEKSYLKGLNSIKSGLMHDLLTGNVTVEVKSARTDV
tara:strand:- start:29980 stop:31320 length:1341 start_codon:yes stop_codon:yes gene_type:complete